MIVDTARCVEVSLFDLGAQIAIAHSAGETILALLSVDDFSETGGEVSYLDPVDDVTVVTVAYTGKDDDAGTLTLAAGLPDALDADTFISIHPPNREKRALVKFDEESKAIPARLTHTVRDLLTEGVRDPDEQEAVEVTVDASGAATVTDVLGEDRVVIAGAGFRTATGFDDIEIAPGDVDTPSAIRFLSDGEFYDLADPASLSCFDEDTGSDIVFRVRLQGAKSESSGVTPRIDIVTTASDLYMRGDIEYHAGGGVGTASHIFFIDGSERGEVGPDGFSARGGGGFITNALDGGGTTAAAINNAGRLVRDTSSGTRKKEIRDLTVDEAKVALNLRPVTFEWRDGIEMGTRRVPGFIAEEADAAGAELWVAYDNDDPETGTPTGFRYPELTAAHTVLIRELRDENTALKERLARCEAALGL